MDTIVLLIITSWLLGIYGPVIFYISLFFFGRWSVFLDDQVLLISLLFIKLLQKLMGVDVSGDAFAVFAIFLHVLTLVYF